MVVVRKLSAAAIVVIACSSWSPDARAQVCAAGITAMAPPIISFMEAGTASLIAMNEVQTQMIVSALKARVAQSSVGASQVNETLRQSGQSNAQAYVQSRVNMHSLDAMNRYASLGYNGCGVESAMTSFGQAYTQTFSNPGNYNGGGSIAGAPGRMATNNAPTQWFQQVNTSTGASAADLFGGDQTAAAKYINVALGPPPTFSKGDAKTADGGLRFAEKIRKDSLKGASMFIMNQIAAEYSAGGPKEKLDSVLNQWFGSDGGSTWGQATAAEEDRGLLLDATRIEAAQVAALAYEIRNQMRTEYAIAAYALARAEKLAAGEAR